VAVDATGNVYFSEFNYAAVEQWNAKTGLTFVVGNGSLNTPEGVAVDAARNLYIADSLTCLRRRYRDGLAPEPAWRSYCKPCHKGPQTRTSVPPLCSGGGGVAGPALTRVENVTLPPRQPMNCQRPAERIHAAPAPRGPRRPVNLGQGGAMEPVSPRFHCVRRDVSPGRSRPRCSSSPGFPASPVHALRRGRADR
jgi:hypothetical protein